MQTLCFQDNSFVGMMRYSATGSAYEKDMSDVIPLVKYHEEVIRPTSRLLTRKCHFNAKRNVGKWGKLNTFIEYGNMYQLHRSKPPRTWTIQQRMYARYINNFGKPPVLLSYMANQFRRSNTLSSYRHYWVI